MGQRTKTRVSLPTTHRLDLRRIGGDAFSEVLLVWLGLPVTLRDGAGRGARRAVPENVVASVRLVGERIAGGVRLALPLAFMTLAVRRLTGHERAEPGTDELLADAAGELANMVAGRVAAQLAARGFPCALGTPMVSRDAAWPLEPDAGTDRSHLALECDGHPLSLEVRCDYVNP